MLQTKISDLTVDEFRALMRDIVRQAFSEMLNEDPDEGLSVREDVEEALRRSVKAIREGGQTYSAEEAAKRLGVEW
ncbi:MAG: hypothetical protein ACOYYU_01790 [Chloroflexota bacterium]